MPSAAEPLRHVPPILKSKGLKVLDVGVDDGHPFILLGADTGKVRRVTIYLLADTPGRFVYGYTIFDEKARAEVTYHGEHGDPDKDELGDIEGTW